jgi:D-alanine-D-alanine ligase
VAHVIALTHGPALVEAFVPGAEYQLCMLADWPEALPLIELRGLTGVYDSAHKHDPDSPVTLVVASLAPAVEARMRDAATRAWRALGIRDYARFDIRLAADGTPVFLEANVKPSFEEGCALDIAMRAGGRDVRDAVHHLVARATG